MFLFLDIIINVRHEKAIKECCNQKLNRLTRRVTFGFATHVGLAAPGRGDKFKVHTVSSVGEGRPTASFAVCLRLLRSLHVYILPRTRRSFRVNILTHSCG